MKNIAVLFAGGLSSYAGLPIEGTETAYQRAVKTAGKLPEVSKVLVLCDGDLPAGGAAAETLRTEGWTRRSLLESLERVSEGYDNTFFFHADCPLVDTALAEKMYHDHMEYYAEYTFADGYPYGLCPEILKRKIFPALLRLDTSADLPVTRDALFQVIQKDINAFDIETRISPVDQRLLRVSLTCDTKRNHLLVRRIIEAGGRDEASIISVLKERSDLLRTLPAYVSIQVTDGYPQEVTYLPENYYPALNETSRREITPDDAVTLAGKVSDFAGDVTFCLSYRGDPAMHSRIFDITAGILDIPGAKILLETPGVGWRREALEGILSLDGKRITWIVELDARDRDIYRRLRGEGYDEAYGTAENLLKAVPESTYVQAVRMKSNEEDLEQFYRYWKDITDHVIIKKYDHFCGLLPQVKVTDLSPLKRFPCWHLKRDLYVLVDGSVPMCSEDLKPETVPGNVLHDSIADVWDRGYELYTAHVSGEYPSICTECDEYYTFNF